MADLESIIADMREYGTAGIDAYLGPHHMALCLKQQANIWADQLAALSHAAGQEVAVTEVVRTAPERIWLQVADDTYYASEPFPYDIGEITWCQDSVMSVEVKYIRADLAPAVARSEGDES